MNASKQSKGPLSEINIIPLVDVMLVLLIIFMIAAPMMQQGLPIDLPKVTTKPLPSKDDIQVLSITKDRGLILNEKRLELQDLKPAIQFLFANKTNKEIFLKADSSVPYGVVVSCMGAIREAGVEKVNIVTKPPDER
ncbi:MAG: Biopolymer transport protein ExbD [Syntrophorhabdaceae bacterium PtaU1.Bin034]|jgi:biopolymer transport protein TolR|nr:MAG: Biopolymer transport protein ExbD [Syntrophorhabdaceae bacterium PtaU1.Bin034]